MEADPPSASGLLHRNVQRFRRGLVFKARRLCVSLNSRLESNKEEEVGVAPDAEPPSASAPPPRTLGIGLL